MEPFNPDCPVNRFHEALKRRLPAALDAWRHSEGTTESHVTLPDLNAVPVRFYWPPTGLDLDGYDAMLDRVIDTLKQHAEGNHLICFECYMQRRHAHGWLEWTVVLRHIVGGRRLLIAHIQRAPDAEVERHS